MTTTLSCKIIQNGEIPENSVGIFNSDGKMVLSETRPGYILPSDFNIEVEDGLEASVTKNQEGYFVHEDDMDVFVAMFFG